MIVSYLLIQQLYPINTVYRYVDIPALSLRDTKLIIITEANLGAFEYFIHFEVGDNDKKFVI